MRNKRGTLLIVLGLLLITAALLLTGYNIWDERRAAATADSVLQSMPDELRTAVSEPAADDSVLENPDPQETFIPDYILNPGMEMPTLEFDGKLYIGVISIPSIGVELPVLSEWSTANLRTAPCRYTGSAYTDDMILAGHNYRTHFGSLHRVSIGDAVTFTDAQGNLFCYTVAEMEVLDGKAVEQMQSGDWDLTLFTCTYGGRSRITVRCERTKP